MAHKLPYRQISVSGCVAAQFATSACHIRCAPAQGSVLGPLLFLILLANIDERVVNAFVSSFADDTRVGMPIASPEDTQRLQQDLDKIYDWAKENNMQFNSDKFEMLRYQANPRQPAQLRHWFLILGLRSKRKRASVTWVSRCPRMLRSVRTSQNELHVSKSYQGGHYAHSNPAPVVSCSRYGRP